MAPGAGHLAVLATEELAVARVLELRQLERAGEVAGVARRAQFRAMRVLVTRRAGRRQAAEVHCHASRVLADMTGRRRCTAARGAGREAGALVARGAFEGG